MGKYYAVRNGRSQGVFNDWNDCKAQVDGYSGARFKSFPTREAAEAFASGRGDGSGGGSGGSGGGYSSGSQRAWSGSSKPYSSGSRVISTSRTSYRSSSTPSSSYSSSSSYKPPANVSSYTGASSYGTTSTSSRSTGTSSRSGGAKTRIYTDGSSLGNGKRGAKAGWASYWGPSDPRNDSGPVETGEQTNNRGELIAIHRTLEKIDSDTKNGIGSSSGYQVMADSHYARDSLDKWTTNWASKGWKTSTGKDVKNRDIIEPAHKLLTDLRQRGVSVDIDYVPAHSGHDGNEAADLMARNAAQTSSR